MTFIVPEEYRIKTGKFASSPQWGNNGLFIVIRHRNQYRIIASDQGGWEHVSVSLPTRTPTWKEMNWIKDLFWGPEDCVIQYHPPKSEYINYHSHCLHLWRPTDQELPRPNPILVGPYDATKPEAKKNPR